MSLSLSRSQMQAFDTYEAERFFRELKKSLFDSFEDVPMDQAEALFYWCRVACADLGIETELALRAFFELSFEQRQPLSSIPEFARLQSLVSQQFHDPERLTLELYEKL